MRPSSGDDSSVEIEKDECDTLVWEQKISVDLYAKRMGGYGLALRRFLAQASAGELGKGKACRSVRIST